MCDESGRRPTRQQRAKNKTPTLAKKSTNVCGCPRVMTQMKHANVNINSNKNLFFMKSKHAKNSVYKKLQSFLSNDGIVLASQKTLASIATLLLA